MKVIIRINILTVTPTLKSQGKRDQEFRVTQNYVVNFEAIRDYMESFSKSKTTTVINHFLLL